MKSRRWFDEKFSREFLVKPPFLCGHLIDFMRSSHGDGMKKMVR